MWDFSKVEKLYNSNFNELLFQAQSIHRQHFPNDEIQLSTLISIKTGACPEDCAYCPQSGHFDVEIKKEKLMPVAEVLRRAKLAKSNGATRFCMGAAWRNPPLAVMQQLCDMIVAIKQLGLETCMTLGMLSDEQAQCLRQAGLDYYNHNLDTSPEYYKKIITTRNYQDRLDTLQRVAKANIKICCGGIIGMGETREDRIELLLQLAKLATPPCSVPINQLTAVSGTPLADSEEICTIEFIRTVAIARIMLPTSMVRLSAGRNAMSDEKQALCFLAGANSIHYGEEKLFVTANPKKDRDLQLLAKLGMKAMSAETAANHVA